MREPIPSWDGRHPGDPASEATSTAWALAVRAIRIDNRDTNQVCRERRRRLVAG